MARKSQETRTLVSSVKRILANRRNAQKSTGPKSQAGKDKVRFNACTHGLTAQTTLLPSDDFEAYHNFHAQALAELQPVGWLETQLAARLISLSWKLNRCDTWDHGFLSSRVTNLQDIQIDDARIALTMAQANTAFQHHKAIESLGRQEARLARQQRETIAQFRAMQAERKAAEAQELARAAALKAQHETQQKKAVNAAPQPYEPSLDGFVLTNDQIDNRMHRIRRQQEADGLILKARIAA